MDMKEKIKQLRRKYGEIVVTIDNEELKFKPTTEFHEGLILAANSDDGNESSVKYFLREFPKIVSKDLGINLEDAKLLVYEYANEFVESYINSLGKKKEK